MRSKLLYNSWLHGWINSFEYWKADLYKSYSPLFLSDAPSSVSTKVQGNEQLALKLGRPARLRGRPVSPQRLDAGQGRGTSHQQNPSAHSVWPQQNSLPDVHKIPSGWDQSQLASLGRGPLREDLWYLMYWTMSGGKPMPCWCAMANSSNYNWSPQKLRRRSKY